MKIARFLSFLGNRGLKKLFSMQFLFPSDSSFSEKKVKGFIENKTQANAARGITDAFSLLNDF